jgi:hypothetical protein
VQVAGGGTFVAKAWAEVEAMMRTKSAKRIFRTV